MIPFVETLPPEAPGILLTSNSMALRTSTYTSQLGKYGGRATGVNYNLTGIIQEKIFFFLLGLKLTIADLQLNFRQDFYYLLNNSIDFLIFLICYSLNHNMQGNSVSSTNWMEAPTSNHTGTNLYNREQEFSLAPPCHPGFSGCNQMEATTPCVQAPT
jgi:hypothetical protein